MIKNILRVRAYRWVVAAVLVAMLGGCGGEDESKSASQAPGGNAPPSIPPPISQPGAATLEWTVPTTETDGSTLADLAGYRIHYGKNVAALNTTIEILNPTVSSYVIENLEPGTYYFAVTAFNSRNHESERSNAGKKEIT
jgi:hypothetical protein